MRQDAVILFFLLYSKHIKHKNNNYMNFCIIDKEFLNKKIPEAVIGFSPNLPNRCKIIATIYSIITSSSLYFHAEEVLLIIIKHAMTVLFYSSF